MAPVVTRFAASDQARPGDLAVEQTAKIDFVINPRTAKAIGAVIPQSLLLRANEVIQ